MDESPLLLSGLSMAQGFLVVMGGFHAYELLKGVMNYRRIGLFLIIPWYAI